MILLSGTFSIANAIWSFCLVAFLGTVIWIKLHLLRLELHTLVEKLPNLGSEFIKREISDVRRDLDQTIARVRLCEQRQGINGDEA